MEAMMKYHPRSALTLAVALPVSILLTFRHNANGDDGSAQEKFQSSTQEGWRTFPGNRPGVGDTLNKLDRITNLDANRELSNEDRKNILALADFLIDKRFGRGPRESAAKDLGRYGHSLAIPALLAVIRDEEDNIEVRKRAVLALGKIRDKRIVMYIVEEGFGSGNNQLILSSMDALGGSLSDVPDKLKDASWYRGFRPPPGANTGLSATPEEIKTPVGSEKLEPYLDIWREWWRKNHNEVTLCRPLGIP